MINGKEREKKTERNKGVTQAIVKVWKPNDFAMHLKGL